MQSLELVVTTRELAIIFVQHKDRVLYTDDDEQRREHTRKYGKLIAKGRHQAEHITYRHHDYRQHRYQHTPRAEQQVKNQCRHHNREYREQHYLPYHHLCCNLTDIRKTGDVHLNAVPLTEALDFLLNSVHQISTKI